MEMQGSMKFLIELDFFIIQDKCLWICSFLKSSSIVSSMLFIMSEHNLSVSERFSSYKLQVKEHDN